MKKIIILTILMWGGITAFGQQTLLLERSSSNLLAGISSANKEVNLPKEIKGSQYFQENFMYAFVDDMNKPFKMRYNAFFDEMEFENDGVIYDLDKNQYKVINFDDLNKKFIIAEYSDGNKIVNGYLVEIVGEGDVLLYKREKMEFSEAKKSGTGFGIDTPPAYKPKKDDFFVKIAGGSIIPLPSSKSKIMDLFGDKSKALNSFVKENRISLNSEKDLKRLFQYANSI